MVGDGEHGRHRIYREDQIDQSVCVHVGQRNTPGVERVTERDGRGLLEACVQTVDEDAGKR